MEYVLPIRLSASLRRFQSKFLLEEYSQLLELERASLKAVLPKELVADDVLFAAVNEAVGVGCWISLRVDQGLSPEGAEAVLRRTVYALIDTWPPDAMRWRWPLLFSGLALFGLAGLGLLWFRAGDVPRNCLLSTARIGGFVTVPGGAIKAAGAIYPEEGRTAAPRFPL